MKKNVCLIVGTRPEAIKMARVYAALSSSDSLHPYLVSTGQHREMLIQTLGVFGLVPDVSLELMQEAQTLPALTSRVLVSLGALFQQRRFDAVLVQGDTTTVLGAALAAFYAQVPIGHVEAGLRTHDLRSPFPEEMNRRLTSPLARWHFCPTELSRQNLLREHIASERCFVTGNPVIDALLSVRDRLHARGGSGSELVARLGIPAAFARRFLGENGAPWILVTGHRRESFGGGFERICHAINRLTEVHPDLGVLYPVHLNPQVQEPVRRLLGANERIALVAPASYEDFIWLLDRCKFALSDSGGLQEEAPSLGKPVLVMRETTERPEGVEAGTCTLVGTDSEKILREAGRLLKDPQEYARRSALKNPYGDGHAAERIRAILEQSLTE